MKKYTHKDTHNICRLRVDSGSGDPTTDVDYVSTSALNVLIPIILLNINDHSMYYYFYVINVNNIIFII